MRRRAVTSAAVAVALATVLGGCGGSVDGAVAEDAPATVSSSPSDPPRPSAPPTTPAEPEPTAEPLSGFEDRPPVRVARAWAEAFATSVNEDDPQLRAVAPLATTDGLQRMVGYGAEDAGLHYPGPLPFTPVGVEVDGDGARVPMCLWAEGFALDRETKQPAMAKLIAGGALLLTKHDGAWIVDDLVSAGDVECSGVAVKGRGW
jgi:hypothetical protein